MAKSEDIAAIADNSTHHNSSGIQPSEYGTTEKSLVKRMNEVLEKSIIHAKNVPGYTQINKNLQDWELGTR